MTENTITTAAYEGDLVARLRGWRGLHLAHGGRLYDEAADEIERLRQSDRPQPITYACREDQAMALAEKLKVARNALFLTLETVSERTGIGLATLSEFENAKREPRLVQLRQLADIYRRSVWSFLEDEPLPIECVLWTGRPLA